MCLRVEIFKMSTVYNLNHFSTLFFGQVMKELKNNFIIEIVFPALYIQNTGQFYSHECTSSTGYKVLKISCFCVEIIIWFIWPWFIAIESINWKWNL